MEIKSFQHMNTFCEYNEWFSSTQFSLSSISILKNLIKLPNSYMDKKKNIIQMFDV